MSCEKKENLTLQDLCREYRANNQIKPEMYKKYRVKRGLRNEDGTCDGWADADL